MYEYLYHLITQKKLDLFHSRWELALLLHNMHNVLGDIWYFNSADIFKKTFVVYILVFQEQKRNQK